MIKKILVGVLLLTSVGMLSAKDARDINRQSARPIPITGMQIVKKGFLSPEFEEVRGKPSFPPGQEPYEAIATGVLGTEVTGNKYAVVIGICDYPGTTHDLCLSDGDSLNMYKALHELYDYDDANIYLFRDVKPSIGDDFPTDGAATFNNIETAITEIKNKVTDKDEVVFFFSGHGGWLLDDDGNPIDINGDEEDGRDEVIIVHDGEDIVGIADDTLVGWFDNFITTRIVFIFDTCLAGGMNDLADDGRIVVMATDETHSAYVYSTGTYDIDEDGIFDGEGVFTHFFVNEGMLQGLADTYNHTIPDNNPGMLGEDVVIEEAFDHAKESIPNRLKHRQKPIISDLFYNDLLL